MANVRWSGFSALESDRTEDVVEPAALDAERRHRPAGGADEVGDLGDN